MFQKANPLVWAWTSIVSIACTMLAAPALCAQVERPNIADISSDHGSMQPSAQITLTVHLKMHNQAAFDKAVDELYTPGSPTYHQWMTNSDIARYAPTEAEVDTVKKELESHGLSILSVSSDHLAIHARGPATSVESAFQTQIHEFERQGKVFHANTVPAKLAGPAGDLVHGVTGLTSLHMQPFIKSQVDPRTGKPRTTVNASAAGVSAAKGSAAGGFAGIATNNCFSGLSTVNLTTSGATLPDGVYSGNVYGNSSLICSWTPSQLQAHYGLTAAYKQGLDGTGQTIVIVDGPTDAATLTSDLTLFSSLTGLPAPTASTFSIIYPDGKPTSLELQVDNWQTESSIDAEWSHAIAPKAKIIVEIMPTEDWTELEYGIDYARQNKLGNVISNSYGLPEALFGNQTVKGFDQVLKKAAAAGIAVNFATGDVGDAGQGAPNAGGESYPATSTYGTAVGGTSLGIPNGTANGAEVGWGHNLAYLSFGTGSVLDPPEGVGNVGGAGGGESIFFAKPSWEKSLQGTGRLTPDISAVGDPYTGVVLVAYGEPEAGWGGTSLSCPIFSAIWAIADQKAGTSLGQAAPLLAKLSAPAITDVIPVSSPTNVAGIVFDSAGPTFYSSDTLLFPLDTTTQYYSALWSPGGGEYIDFSFGTDTSLTVTPGWDNVTGWGVPNGLSFINAAAKAK